MQDVKHDPIAIIGIGCRFPGAANPSAFWRLLSEGRNAIREVPAERWDIDSLYDPDPAAPGKTTSRWGGFLDQIDQFDWRAFHLLPREVKHMDPQHRLLLELAWEALEDAGIPFEEIASSKTAVNIGISWNDYLRLLSRNWSQLDAYTALGNGLSFAANRLSYIFDLKGPSMSIDTGCTSSLMSIYMACQSLWSGEASLALAGGVNLILSPDLTIVLSQAGFLSPDGQCKTLDARADGFVRGEGAGIVILKPLSQVKSSDRVYALINGIAASHNGHNEWMIASSRDAQEALIREAHSKAGVDPAEVDYVELHGTGFLRGDAIEVEALSMALGDSNERRARPCLIGSVKTNIGHLEAASGIASLIKVALSLYHQKIPPTLNFQTLNPNISLQDLHLAVQQEMSPWPEKDSISLASVTGLSMSGTNVHAVLTAHPACSTVPIADQQVRLLPLSAHSKEALSAQAMVMRDFLLSAESTASYSWQDICYTASVRRTHRTYRLAVIGSSKQEAASMLNVWIQASPDALPPSQRQGKLVFLFAHRSASPQSVLEDEFLLKNTAFHATVQECEHIINLLTQRSLSELQHIGLDPRAVDALMHFIQQIALATLWRSWNITPVAVLGEGLGEIAAAYIAGVITLEDAFQILFYSIEHSLLLKLKNFELLLNELYTTPPLSTAFYSTLISSVSNEERIDASVWKVLVKDAQIPEAVIDQLLTHDHDTFLEIGSSSAFSATISARFPASKRPAIHLPSLVPGREIASVLLETLGIVYARGYNVDWSALYADNYTCVSLPPYQWQRERFWPDWLDREEMSTPPESRRVMQPIEANGIPSLVPLPECADTAFELDAANDVEGQIVKVWQVVLGLDQIEGDENFFTLGGTSLLAGQLLARLHRIFQVRLSITTLFENPTVAALAEFIRNTQTSTSNEQIKAFENRDQQAVFPLSFAQQRLWFLDQLQYGSPVYNVAVAFCLKGVPDIQKLEQSLNEIVRRHATLRTTFPVVDGQPAQVVAASLCMLLERDNLETFPAKQRKSELLQLAIREVKKPFSLAEGPLLRTRLVSLDAYEHILLLTVHHIIFDGWSMGIFYRELNTLYDAYVQSQPFTLPELPIQYTDYTTWEHGWLEDNELQIGLSYWKQQLTGAPPALEIPTDHPRPAVETFRGAYESFMLPSSLLDELKALSNQENVTLFMTLLAAFQVQLAHYSRQDDIVVGTDVANRTRVEMENLIGFFVNQLVLRTDLSDNPSLSKLLQRVRKVVLEAYEHQSIPYDQVVRTLNPVRFSNRASLFQVKLVLQNLPVLNSNATITVDPLLVDAGVAQLDLILDLTVTASGLRAIWQYNTDIFDGSSIKRMNKHFLLLLKIFVDFPSSTLSSFNAALDEEESQQRHLQQHQLAQMRHQRLKMVLSKPVTPVRKEN